MEFINLVEVFSSIQGEGKYVGYRQVFVRLAGCNMKCEFCDTPSSRNDVAFGQIETAPGKRVFLAAENPVTIDRLAAYINQLLIEPHHSVSFTGGEPLCQAGALAKLAQKVTGAVYLETNGTLPDELAEVLPYVDIISMDVKLPSTSGREYWSEHIRFLQLAQQREVFVKIVLTAETADDEFARAIELVAAVKPSIPLILQPVSPVEGVKAISPADVLKRQSEALQSLKDVRVIPQTHKFLGQM